MYVISRSRRFIEFRILFYVKQFLLKKVRQKAKLKSEVELRFILFKRKTDEVNF